MVFKINKTEDYSIISNKFLREKDMSLKAKGLLALMLSLPDSWVYSINGLVAICKEEESAIKTTLQELKRFGYLSIDKCMPNTTQSGRIEYVYNIYEEPHQKQEGDFLPLEILPLENQGQYNTNKEEYKDKENIKRNENIVQPSFLANYENQVQNEKVDLEMVTPTSTPSLTATNEQPSSRQKANKGTDTETKIEQVIDFFDKTYSLYPRKVSRGRAQTTFIHKVFARDYTESRKRALYIYKCLERQIVEWANEGNGKGRGKDFMPYMSSWLNDNFEDVPKKERGKIK